MGGRGARYATAVVSTRGHSRRGAVLRALPRAAPFKSIVARVIGRHSVPVRAPRAAKDPALPNCCTSSPTPAAPLTRSIYTSGGCDWLGRVVARAVPSSPAGSVLTPFIRCSQGRPAPSMTRGTAALAALLALLLAGEWAAASPAATAAAANRSCCRSAPRVGMGFVHLLHPDPQHRLLSTIAKLCLQY